MAASKQARNTARAAALRALVAVEKGRQARLDGALRLDQLDPRERGLALELARGTERLHLLLDFVLGQVVDRSLPRDPITLSLLRLGAYQLLFVSRIPARAAVHETVALRPEKRGFANAVLRNLGRRIEARGADPLQPRTELELPEGPEGARALVLDKDSLPELGSAAFLACRYGLPPFLVERWVAEFGFAEAEMVATASTLAPQVVLRPTSRVPGGADLPTLMAPEGVELQSIGLPDMFVVVEGQPFSSKAFAAGMFVAQDPTALAAVDALQARPGERILDLCAAPGTKTLRLAEQVGPSGRVYAFDIDSRRRARIEDNLQRIGLQDRVEVLTQASVEPPPAAVLVDAPCSNTGVLARRVEVRRRLQPDAFAGFAATQAALLGQAAATLAPGGRILYSTCSIDRAENQDVVQAFLAAHPDFSLQGEQLTLPEPLGCDGGYFALLSS